MAHCCRHVEGKINPLFNPTSLKDKLLALLLLVNCFESEQNLFQRLWSTPDSSTGVIIIVSCYILKPCNRRASVHIQMLIKKLNVRVPVKLHSIWCSPNLLCSECVRHDLQGQKLRINSDQSEGIPFASISALMNSSHMDIFLCLYCKNFKGPTLNR